MREASGTDLVWIDVETTGLDVARDVVLEVGLVVTNKWGMHLARTRELVHFDINARTLDTGDIDPWVMHTHDKSGLWDECAASNQTLSEADSALASWMDSLGLAEKPVMCGSSVQFDREFTRAYMPSVFSRFHYRNMDVSTLRTVAGWMDREFDRREPKHRVWDDLDQSIAEYQEFLKMANFS